MPKIEPGRLLNVFFPQMEGESVVKVMVASQKSPVRAGVSGKLLSLVHTQADGPEDH